MRIDFRGKKSDGCHNIGDFSALASPMLSRTFLVTLAAAFSIFAAGADSAAAAAASPCPDNPDALGTARVLAVEAAATPQVGRLQFPQTLALAPGEVVLTFDDGPWPGTTERVLDTLRRECVRATFFLIGRNAQAHPALVRRELAEGHTVAYHSFSHPLMSRLSFAAAQGDIAHGIAAVDGAIEGSGAHAAPFFRFPGFASTPPLLDWLEHRGIAVFGADLWASDWNRMSPEQELRLVLKRLSVTRGGILLLHDTKAQTAAMLAPLLRELKARGYAIVQATAPAARGQAAAEK